MTISDIETARALLAEARYVAVLTGSGISAESGVPTFRGEFGLWEGQDVMKLASVEGFQKDPRAVWQFYNERLTKYAGVEPNPGHVALARLEQQVNDRGGRFALITQNIDGLHQLAGSSNVLELHGCGRLIRCTKCAYERDIDAAPLDDLPTCPACSAVLRPDVVWFGEGLPPGILEAASDASGSCDVFMTIGTSAVVYPAAALPPLAAQSGAKTIEVNPEPTPLTALMTLSLRGAAGDILPQLVD